MLNSREVKLRPFDVRCRRNALARFASALPLVVLTLTLALCPRPSFAAPTAPGPTTVACDYSVSDNCWVTGDFVASVSPATGGVGSLVYQICRSLDSPGGFAGCDVNLTLNGTTSIAVSGSHLPSDGSRRAYYFLARDSTGVLGPWNSPRYVRVDRYAPTVSASNASAAWFSSRTATISADDATGGASANSGLVAVRYRWNSALDGGCTAGTATSAGTTLTAPGGDNILYLCARDNTGRVTQWNGQYRVSAPLTAPGPTTVGCAYSVSDNCWVTGDFVASVSPATGGVGSLVYQICRSLDSPGGFAGCDVNLTLNGTTSITVSGTHLPSDGSRRAYYFLARDSTGTLGPWSSPRYVRVDRYAPTVSATNASATWSSSLTATIAAADATGGAGANSGLVAVRYRWNSALDAGCTAGTATSSGAALTAPAGDNILYLCARDNTGRVAQWNGQYRVSTPPTAPGPTTVSCAYSVLDNCWVTGDFVASVTPATGGTGALVYQICRSNDSPGGFGGCEANLTLNGTTSITITGTNLPSDGFRRAYYFLARDSVGVLGPWNTPRYVRVDRYVPTVSASNASTTWYSSRTATVSADDVTGGAGANSGLMGVRYRWNSALDAGCTAGTATTSGSTLTAPTGDNILYLCARDNTGRVTQWNGQYRVSAAPTAPGPTTVSCAYSVSDNCWVTGDFVASVTPSTGGTGSLVYQICRSNDSAGGFAGCETNLTLNGGTSITVSGTHLPSDGSRRAYYFLARDSVGVLGPWNTPRYVRVDRYAPTVSATNASDTWYSSRTATISADDATVSAGANSGVAGVRYNWNTALDAACAAGTATTSGTTLTAPSGDNTLYLCARDNTGRVTQWSGRYRVGNVPTEPGPTTVSCAYAVSDDCWVTGDFVASVTPATGGTGALTYRICRSLDSPGGFAGCDVNLTPNGGTSITVSGTHLPSDGFRRAYYFLAQDTVGAYGPWNTPRYVRVDRNAPAVSATNASSDWFPSRTATLSASDTTGGASANSGLVEIRYSWNSAPNAGCTTGTVATSGTALTAPAGDNILYLCGRDNTGRVGTWNGRYRVGTASLTVTTTPSPAESPYGTPIFWTATASGGAPATRQYALFRRRPGGNWTPALTSPSWQNGTTLGWTPNSNNVGVWEITIWVKDANTLPDENTYGYTDSFNPGNVEIVAPAGFTLNLSPSAASVSPGGQAQFTVSLTPEAGFTGTAALSVSGLPAGATQTLDPAAIGAGASSTLTVTTAAGTPPGDNTLTITGTSGSLTRTATAQLRVANSQKPVLNSISPESFASGGRVRVTVQGSFLSGSTVSIAQEQTDPDDPVSRVFPTAQVISINAAGTSMVVEIDATNPGILDFYNLVVDNGADIEAIQFRVLPNGPLVDAWTPSQPEVGLIHALSIAGRNLAGATVTPSLGNRILLHSVETSDTEITALLEVLPNAPTGPMSLIVSRGGHTISVPITIEPGGKTSGLKMHNLTESRNGEKVAGDYSRRPAIWFQEFVIRDPDHTEVLDKGLGLRIQPLDAETLAARRASAKSISFELYIRVTIPLVRVQWQKVILFDPITGAIGDAVLQSLGVGARVPIGAFVISAYFQMDLTIYFRLTNAGFTFPRFCIEITYGIEITGFDGFAYAQSFCVGGGWYAFGTGSVSSGEISGGNCASVTPKSFADGIVEGEVQQNACCAQPIGVAMSGHTFSGLAWQRSFNLNNPQAGTTTPANPVCNCTVDLHPAVVRPGFQTTMPAFISNGSNQPVTYTWTLQKTSGSTDILIPQSTGTVQVNANKTVQLNIPVGFAAGLPAPDVPELKFEAADGNCQAAKTSTVCVYPTDESSRFVGWSLQNPNWDAARFFGDLEPGGTSFVGRRVNEGQPDSGTSSFDTCYTPGSPFPDYRLSNLSGGSWDIVTGNTFHEADLIGFKGDFDGYYASIGRVPCSAGTTQTMYIYCTQVGSQVTSKEYTKNMFKIEATPNGTRVTRDGVSSGLH